MTRPIDTINLFIAITITLASIMTAIHYAVLWVRYPTVSELPTEAADTPVDTPATSPVAVEKFDAVAGAQWVADARRVAIMIADEREDGCCDADAVWFECPPPAGVDGRLLSTVFDRREWEIVDRRLSSRGRNAARQIAVWRRKVDVKVAE